MENKVEVETVPDSLKAFEERILEDHRREQQRIHDITQKLLDEERLRLKGNEPIQLEEECREEVVGDVLDEEDNLMDMTKYEVVNDDEAEEERITEEDSSDDGEGNSSEEGMEGEDGDEDADEDDGEGSCSEKDRDGKGSDAEDRDEDEGSGSDTDVPRNVCKICDQIFTKASNLRAHHAYRHTEKQERNYLCPECDRPFVKKRDVKRHLDNNSCHKVSKNGKKIGRALGSHNKTTVHHNRRKSKEPTTISSYCRAKPKLLKRLNTISEHRRANPKLLGEAVVNLAKIDIADFNNNNEEDVEVDRYLIENDLAADAVVGTVIGNFSRASKEVKHPFQNSTEVYIRSWVKNRRLVGPQTINENRRFAEHLFEMGDFTAQLGRCQGSKERVIGLIESYLPLVVGEAELEIFLLPPGTYEDDSGGFGIGCGVRRPHGTTPLKPGPQNAVYADLMRINDKVWNSMEDWQLFSTLTIADGRTNKNGTHFLLGPLQFVSG